MKKSSSLKVQETLQSKFSNGSINSDLDKKIIYKRKNTKKDEYKKIMPTKGKVKESPKEEKKEIRIKSSKENNKNKKFQWKSLKHIFLDLIHLLYNLY